MKKAYLVVAIAMVTLGFGARVRAAVPDGVEGPWADTVLSAPQGTNFDGNPVNVERSDPWDVLGPAESEGVVDITTADPSTAYSLGSKGIITVGFENTILNLKGPDLQLFQIMDSLPLRKGQIERVKVEVDQDPYHWVTIARNATYKSKLDLGRLSWAKYVQITDSSNRLYFYGGDNGFDLDGIKALHTTTSQPWSGQVHDPRFYRLDNDATNDSLGEHTLLPDGRAGYCGRLWNQVIAFNNNWEANATVNDVAFQDTVFYSQSRFPTFTNTALTSIHDRLDALTCDRSTPSNKEIRELGRVLEVINRGQYLWDTPVVMPVIDPTQA